MKKKKKLENVPIHKARMVASYIGEPARTLKDASQGSRTFEDTRIYLDTGITICMREVLRAATSLLRFYNKSNKTTKKN